MVDKIVRQRVTTESYRLRCQLEELTRQRAIYVAACEMDWAYLAGEAIRSLERQITELEDLDGQPAV